jgi:hypothetical protein
LCGAASGADEEVEIGGGEVSECVCGLCGDEDRVEEFLPSFWVLRAGHIFAGTKGCADGGSGFIYAEGAECEKDSDPRVKFFVVKHNWAFAVFVCLIGNAGNQSIVFMGAHRGQILGRCGRVRIVDIARELGLYKYSRGVHQDGALVANV